MARRWLIAMLIGAVAGLTTALAIRYLRSPETPAVPEGMEIVTPDAGPAVRYALAFQEGDWDYIIEHTLWIQERLRYERSRTGEAAGTEAARLTISRELGDRSEPGNRLRDTGVEDQYVFRPGAAIEVAARDAGRDDLERPAADRTWLRVRFPTATNALYDASGLAIRAVTVGVNVSSEGYILKANVDGNLDVDWDSIVYWGVKAGD